MVSRAINDIGNREDRLSRMAESANSIGRVVNANGRLLDIEIANNDGTKVILNECVPILTSHPIQVGHLVMVVRTSSSVNVVMSIENFPDDILQNIFAATVVDVFYADIGRVRRTYGVKFSPTQTIQDNISGLPVAVVPQSMSIPRLGGGGIGPLHDDTHEVGVNFAIGDAILIGRDNGIITGSPQEIEAFPVKYYVLGKLYAEEHYDNTILQLSNGARASAVDIAAMNPYTEFRESADAELLNVFIVDDGQSHDISFNPSGRNFSYTTNSDEVTIVAVRKGIASFFRVDYSSGVGVITGTALAVGNQTQFTVNSKQTRVIRLISRNILSSSQKTYIINIIRS